MGEQHREGSGGASSMKTYAGLMGRPLGLLISTIATNGFLLFGYDQGVMSGIIAADPFNAYFPETKDNSVYQGFVTAIYEVGCLFGAVFILAFGDSTGRRRAMMLGGIIMIIGVIIQVSAMKGHRATAQFIIGRTITGFGNGINTSTIPTYQAECSRTTNRGLLICIEGGVIAFGTMIAYWIDYGASYGPDDLTWRFPIVFQVIFGFVLIIGTWFLPESPRWLVTKDRHEDAIGVIAALSGLETTNTEVRFQHSIIVDSIKASGHAGGHVPFSALLTGGKTQHFRRVLLGASSQLFQQLGGCNAVIYYFPILFRSAIGTSQNLALLLGGVNMIVYSISATVSWFIIERAGRRKLLLYGTVGQLLSMVLIFTCLIPDGGKGPSAKGAGVGLFTYIMFFGATWLPLPWLYPAEINPLRTRAKANAVSTITNWTFNFLIVMIVPVMIDKVRTSCPATESSSIWHPTKTPKTKVSADKVPFTQIKWGTYLFFAITNACFIPVIYLFYPETRKRSLEEIDLIFAKGYLENMSYVKASYEMPFLTDREVEQMARQYGFGDSDEEIKIGGDVSGDEKQTSVRERRSATANRGELEPNAEDGGLRND
ncbi:hexose carrier protein [Diplocarpon rosae]|nr:hexose carrier protein [Diplocarpon rosae]